MSHTSFAARTFGLDLSAPDAPEPAVLPMPAPGATLAVVGPSGAGKTLALRRLIDLHPGAREVAPLDAAALDVPVLSLFDVDASSEAVLRTLARVGLADGRLWAMRAGRLSAGERRRVELALALMNDGALVIDELDAHLDADTARVLAQNLRRAAKDRPVVAATHRPETLPYLRPARVFEIDGGAHEIAPPPHADVLDEISFHRGRVRDYDAFARWHYLGPGRPGPSSDVWIARHGARPVGIAMFGYPHLLLSARAKALPDYAPRRIREGGAKGLNANVRLLQRVVVEPRYRGVGVARALIRHGVDHLDVSTVECVAQLGAFSGFLEAAGFRHVADVEPPRAVRRLVAFLEARRIDVQALIRDGDAGLRSLDAEGRRELERLLNAAVRTRIETGFGSRRGNGDVPAELARRVLSRLYARPAYFVRTRP